MHRQSVVFVHCLNINFAENQLAYFYSVSYKASDQQMATCDN